VLIRPPVAVVRWALKRTLKTILIYAWAPFAHLLWYFYTIVMAIVSLLLWPFDRKFRPGAFKIALRAGVPIVPVTIRGTFKLLPKTTLAPRPGRVDVFIGKPIDTLEYTEQRLPELIARTREAIDANLEPALRSQAP
jgi:hypothetical protein